MRLNERNAKLITDGFLIPFLGACVVCMNAIKYLFSTVPNYAFYIIYFLFVSIGLIPSYNKFNFKIKRRDIALFGPFVFLVGYAWASAIVGGFDAISSCAEMSITLFIGISAYFMNDFSICKMNTYIIAISSFHALIILYFPEHLLSTDQNYLSITLPLGLGLSLLLAKIVMMIYSKKIPIRQFVISCCLVILIFSALLQFTARGSILFPVIVMIFIVVAFGHFNKKRFLIALCLFLIVLFVGYKLFEANTSEYIFNRMMRLFQENETESRWVVWSKSINAILENKWYLVGSGVNGFVNHIGFYPHNLYLQLIGEFGILGLAISIYSTSSIIRAQVEMIKNRDNNQGFVICMAGLLYFFLTFMKSFSIYEIYPLIIYFMGIMGMFYRDSY